MSGKMSPGGETSLDPARSAGLNVGELKMLLETLLKENCRKRDDSDDHRSSKALQALVGKSGRFDGKNITKYLREYLQVMELHRVKEFSRISSFELATVPELRGRISNLMQLKAYTDWEGFTSMLKEEFFDDDVERVTKRSFLEWIDTEPGKTMSPTEVLREFEKRYCQLTQVERLALDAKKTELFMQAVDETTADKLWMLLADKTEEDGVTSDWKKVEESVGILSKQRRGRARVHASEGTSAASSKSASGMATPIVKSNVSESTMDQLLKGMRELQIEMVEIKKAQSNPARSSGSFSSQSKPFVKRCIFCDSVEHQRVYECPIYEDYKKRGHVDYKDGRVRFAANDAEIQPNWNKGGMKKIVDDHLAASNAISSARVFHMQAAASNDNSDAIMKRKAEAIRKITGWKDPVLAACIQSYFDDQGMEKDAIVEDKRRRTSEDDREEAAAAKKRGGIRGRSDSQPGTSQSQPEPMDDSQTQAQREKGKDAVPKPKVKGKTPAYKLQSDIEVATDLKEILEERILSSKIEFTLREALGIAKKDFHELIIDVIKRKRQTTAESLATTFDYEEDGLNDVGRVFNHYAAKEISVQTKVEEEVCVGRCSNLSTGKEGFAELYWARSLTLTDVRLNSLREPVQALIDHGSEVNLIRKEVYELGGWPITRHTGWYIKGAGDAKMTVYGACPAVQTKIGDVEIEQNFFIQETLAYPVILGQPYITASRMETKVMNDGSAFAKIRSIDGLKSVQFLTVKPNGDRNRSKLRDEPFSEEEGILDF